MKGERRDQAYDTLRHELRRFGKGMVGIPAGIRELIEAAAELEDETSLPHPGQGRGRDALFGEF
jgi:hypothetical protein